AGKPAGLHRQQRQPGQQQPITTEPHLVSLPPHGQSGWDNGSSQGHSPDATTSEKATQLLTIKLRKMNVPTPDNLNTRYTARVGAGSPSKPRPRRPARRTYFWLSSPLRGWPGRGGSASTSGGSARRR